MTSQDTLLVRARQYQADGLDTAHAFELAVLAGRIDEWPKNWDDDFVALVFGDFQVPDQEIVFDQLGITLGNVNLRKEQPNLVIKSAITVVEARVRLAARSIEGVKDAVSRLNMLVGVLCYASQAMPVRWWSYMTSPGGAGVGGPLNHERASTVLALMQLMSQDVRQKVTAALYWVREPRSLILEHNRADHFAVYAGYWNAFELLVDAALLLKPMPDLDRAEKTDRVRAVLSDLGRTVEPRHIEDLYHNVINPSFRVRAMHALGACFDETAAAHWEQQCFRFDPRERGLYKLRNAINHGIVDIDDPETAMVLGSRFSQLWGLVFGMFNGVIRLSLAKIAA